MWTASLATFGRVLVENERTLEVFRVKAALERTSAPRIQYIHSNG